MKYRRHGARVNQYRQNKFFRCTQKTLYQVFGWREKSTHVPHYAEEAKQFWSKWWDNPAPYKEVLNGWNSLSCNWKITENVEITKEDVTKQLRKMPNWQATGFDRIQGFWLKRFTSQHPSLAEVLNGNIQSLSISSWLVKSRTGLIQKYPAKGNAVRSYGPITCLNLLWKFKTGISSDKFYQHLENKNVILEEQTGCINTSIGTKYQLLID